jgi:hypothetical protein
MDSDLAESLKALKEVFTHRHLRAEFGKADPARVETLRTTLKIPRRFREFLLEADPLRVETRTPVERVELIPSERLLDEQKSAGPGSGGWRPSWVVIAHSTVLGDPYFLDVSTLDAEGDCAVLTAMSGTDSWKPRLCASSFAMFLRILAVTMEAAKDFPESSVDMDDEQVFREALGPRIRQYDPAAAKAGHWT